MRLALRISKGAASAGRRRAVAGFSACRTGRRGTARLRKIDLAGESVDFARQSRRKVNEEGGACAADAVYTVSPTLPYGLVSTQKKGVATGPHAKQIFDAVRTYG